MKKTMITGVQPTGNFTLGNYIGAIKNFVKIQKDYNSYIFIADLHGLTSYQNPKDIHDRILDLAALYMACGVEPKYTKFFVQSDVNEHSVLGFLIAFQCRIGELSRMTQYKSKKEKQVKDGIDLGLLIYPTLMAADILLYDAKYVPIGDDQKQHLELARDLAVRFNNRFGETFTVPEGIITKTGARIMDLQNPSKKMSKSVDGDKGCIYLLDPINVVKKKIKSAVTDNFAKVHYDVENQPGVSNLMTIYSAITEMSYDEIEAKYAGKGYGDFKSDLAEIVGDEVSKIQEKYNYYINTKELDELLNKGRDKAKVFAQRKLKKIYHKLGLGRY